MREPNDMSETSDSAARPAFAAVAATFIVIALIGAYVWYNNKPPVHVGQIVSITAYPIHRELSTGSALGGLCEKAQEEPDHQVSLLDDQRLAPELVEEDGVRERADRAAPPVIDDFDDTVEVDLRDAAHVHGRS